MGYGSKILGLLAELPAKDRARFKDFFANTYWLHSEDMIRAYSELYDGLLKKVREEEKKESASKLSSYSPKQGISKEALYSVSGWDPSKNIDKALTHLLELLGNYLAFVQLMDDKHSQSIFLLKSMNRRRMRSWFQSFWNKAEKRQKKTEYNEDQFFLRYQLEEEMVFFTASEGDRYPQAHQAEALERLDLAYHARKLKLLVSQLNQSRILNSSAPFEEQEAFISNCQHLPNRNAYIQAYLLAYESLKENNEPAFQRYLTFLESNKQLFQLEELRDLYAIALNVKNRQYQLSTTNRQQTLLAYFEFYRGLIENGILLDGGHQKRRYISTNNFKNLIKIGIHLGKQDWVQTFMAQNAHLLLPEERQITLNFSNGLLLISKQAHKEAIKCMNYVLDHSKDFFYQMDARIMILKSWYYLKEDHEDHLQTIESFHDSVRMYVNRNSRTSHHHQIRFKTFMKYYVKLWRPRYENPKHLVKLIRDIENESVIAEKNWLLKEAKKRLEHIK
ncbi:MAG: hypothetical protein AAF587_14175 [Bacteroidota bacterium]